MGVTFSATRLFLRERSSLQKALGEARDHPEAVGLSLMHVTASQYSWIQKYPEQHSTRCPFGLAAAQNRSLTVRTYFLKLLLFQCRGPMNANKAHIQPRAAPQLYSSPGGSSFEVRGSGFGYIFRRHVVLSCSNIRHPGLACKKLLAFKHLG